MIGFACGSRRFSEGFAGALARGVDNIIFPMARDAGHAREPLIWTLSVPYDTLETRRSDADC